MELSDRRNLAWRQAANRYWELLSVIAIRNLKARYRGSLLGVYWSLLNPLLKTGIYSLIFGTAFASYYGDSIVNYILAAFTGLVVINFFSTATTQALVSVVGRRILLNKIQIPVSVFPASTVLANLVQFGVAALPLLAVMTLITSHSVLNLLALLLPMLGLVLVCLGIGLLTSALYVFFRDLSYFYELVVFALAMTSPVFYPAAILPKNLLPILRLNPVFAIIESTRQIVLSGELPELSLALESLVMGSVLFVAGCLCFRWLRPYFMDLL